MDTSVGPASKSVASGLAQSKARGRSRRSSLAEDARSQPSFGLSVSSCAARAPGGRVWRYPARPRPSRRRRRPRASRRPRRLRATQCGAFTRPGSAREANRSPRASTTAGAPDQRKQRHRPWATSHPSPRTPASMRQLEVELLVLEVECRSPRSQLDTKSAATIATAK